MGRQTSILHSFATLLLGTAVVSASELKPDEHVLLYPTMAVQTDGGWSVELHGLVYETGAGKDLISDFLTQFGIDEKAEAKDDDSESDDEDEAEDDKNPNERRADESVQRLGADVIAKRIEPFLADSESGKIVTIDICGQPFAMPPTGDDGHFFALVEISADKLSPCIERSDDGRRTIRTTVVTPPSDDRSFTGRVELVSETEISVISDIDDTIKITEVSQTRVMLANTFTRPYRAVPGMAELYRRWARDHKAYFHYVSNSPWPLYASLAPWFDEVCYPRGMFQLRKVEAIRREMFGSESDSADQKVQKIRGLLKRFADQRFILVGDAAEHDPEIYATIARDFPDRIVAIFIRAVSGSDAENEAVRKALGELPRDKWRVFKEAAELADWKP